MTYDNILCEQVRRIGSHGTPEVVLVRSKGIGYLVRSLTTPAFGRQLRCEPKRVSAGDREAHITYKQDMPLAARPVSQIQFAYRATPDGSRLLPTHATRIPTRRLVEAARIFRSRHSKAKSVARRAPHPTDGKRQVAFPHFVRIAKLT